MLAGPNRSYSPVQKAHYIPSFLGRIFFCCSNNAVVHLICVLSVCMRVKSHVESLLSLHPNGPDQPHVTNTVQKLLSSFHLIFSKKKKDPKYQSNQ